MIFVVLILWTAAASTVAFQLKLGPPSQSASSPCDVCFASAPIRGDPPIYTSKTHSNDLGIAEVTTIPIHSLLEAGRIDDAVAELLRTPGNEVPASTYHAVIEACCAGGFEPKRPKKNNRTSADRIDFAAELVRTMEGATAHALGIVISGYARRGRWQDAHQMLSILEETLDSSEDDAETPMHNVSLIVYQTVLVALAKAHKFNQMNSLLTRMRRRGVCPGVLTYNSLLKICAADKVPRWREALSLLSQCQREPGVDPDLITYTTAMKACARARQSDKAMELFNAAKDLGMELDVYFYTTAMDACAKGRGRRSWKTALELLDRMRDEGIAPNEVTYGVAVAACGNGGRWRVALELLDRMRDEGLKINTIAYNSAIAALSRAARTELKHHNNHSHNNYYNRNHHNKNSNNLNSVVGSNDTDLLWEKALDLIHCMEKEGVRRDSFTFSSAISTCGAAGRWQEAVDLIEAMKAEGIKPNRVAYTSAISACANSRQWEPAFALFNDVHADGIQPDVVTYNALIGAGMAAGKPAEVFELWSDMCRLGDNGSGGVSPDIVTLTEVIATLDGVAGSAGRERVDGVFSEAVARGLILRKDSLDTLWEVDLSHMSFPVARAACRFIFQKIVQRNSGGEDGDVRDLSLLTGPSRMREYVRGVLRDELKPAVYCIVPEMEKGTLRVKEKVLRNYIKANN